MLYVQPKGVTIRLGLTYEGHFEDGMRHGRGTLSLRPFTPLPETDNFSPIIIYDGEWQHDLMHGRGKYCCLPMYEQRRSQWANLPTIRKSKNQLLTRDTVTRKEEDFADGFITRQWHKFEGAEVKGGVLECAFEKGKPVGQGKCTFYGSEY